MGWVFVVIGNVFFVGWIVFVVIGNVVFCGVGSVCYHWQCSFLWGRCLLSLEMFFFYTRGFSSFSGAGCFSSIKMSFSIFCQCLKDLQSQIMIVGSNTTYCSVINLILVQ